MNIILGLLLIQCAMGAFDSIWHHEIVARLPSKRSARGELLLHSLREFLYAIVFAGLAWREWHGGWAWMLSLVLLIEIAITLADFVEEDKTRFLPKSERVLHTVIAINYGVWLALFAPYLMRWSQQPSGLLPANYGWYSIVLSMAAVGVLALALRNCYAFLKYSRPPAWVRHPIFASAASNSRTVLVTGATGFIGTALVRKLLARGDSVIVLTRDADKALDKFGPRVQIVTSLDALSNSARIDCIVNLAGAPILALPWFTARRRVLLSSRLEITRALVQLCNRLAVTPHVLISGSAIGYYGVRGDEICDEFELPRVEFQSQLCQQWESVAMTAQTLGVRVVLLRTGLVLGNGGPLPLMAAPLRVFFGAILGDGRQWVSWIHIDDMVRVIEFALDRSSIRGACNATAPKAVRHIDFQRALAKQLHRPLWLRIPNWIIRRMLGEMSRLLVDGQRVVPRAIGVHGFRFKYLTLTRALESLFGARESKNVSIGKVGADEGASVFYNGQCPVCSAEMKHYAAIATTASLPICFVDSLANPLAFASYGLRAEHLEERLYIRESNGRVVSGFDAVLRVWQRLPGRYHWAARVGAMPVVRPLSIFLYDFVVAPSLTRWARRRQRRWLAQLRTQLPENR